MRPVVRHNSSRNASDVAASTPTGRVVRVIGPVVDVEFTRDTMPSPMVGVERWGDTVFAALAGEKRDVLYDSVRQPMWRGDSSKT